MTKDFDVEEILEELTAPSTFNLKDALAKKTSPEEYVTVYLDGKTMHEINHLQDIILDLESTLNTFKRNSDGQLATLLAKEASLGAEASGGITDDPEKEAVTKDIAKHRKATAAEVKKQEAAIAVQEAEVERLIGVVLSSALKFKLRGIISKQVELISAKWNREIKEPQRGDYKTETEYQSDHDAATIKRNRSIVIDQVRTAIVSVTGSDGAEHTGGWSMNDAAELWDVLDDSERTKLRDLAGNLTFANTLFDRVATTDADFLPSV